MTMSFFLGKSITAIECICTVLYLCKFSFGLIKFSFSKLNLMFLSNYLYCKFIETNLINYLPFKAAEKSIICLKF